MRSSTRRIGIRRYGHRHHHWMGSRGCTVRYELSLHVHGPRVRLRGNCSIMMLQGGSEQWGIAIERTLISSFAPICPYSPACSTVPLSQPSSPYHVDGQTRIRRYISIFEEYKKEVFGNRKINVLHVTTSCSTQLARYIIRTYVGTPRAPHQGKNTTRFEKKVRRVLV